MEKTSQCSGTFLYFYQLSKATRSFLCTLQHYGLDCFFTKEQLIIGGYVVTTGHSRKHTDSEENEAAPKQTRKLESVFQHLKQQMLLLREIKARYHFFENDRKFRMFFRSTSQVFIWKT